MAPGRTPLALTPGAPLYCGANRAGGPMDVKHVSEELHLAGLIERWAGRRVVVVGDLMLDRYIYGKADRMSPEAPIPVLGVERESEMLGGAGNVARNIVALGGTASLVAVIGDDAAGQAVTRLLGDSPGLESNLVIAPGRPTTQKTRFVAGVQQLLRADRETRAEVEGEPAKRLIAAACDEIETADAVLISDYAKGALSPALIAAVVAAARKRGIPVVADPKGTDFARYRGVTVIKPNARELAAASALPVGSDEEAEAAARAALGVVEADALLVTRSEHGMTLVERGREGALTLSTRAREVFDVSGAGDTALAAFGLALAARAALGDAAALANVAAGAVVAKVGTAVVYPDELVHALASLELQSAEEKILTAGPALDQVSRWRARGLKIGFTNGCFDLIHPGHVSLLAQARAACDRLVVGLNTDASVRRLKGEGRPVNHEMARAVVLASLATVDAVVLFDTDTPLELIEALAPDVLVKGADYTVDTVVGAQSVLARGGRVLLAELKPGHSTTGTIARLVDAKKVS